MDFDFASIGLVISSSTVFSAGGFYLLTKFRLAKIETEQKDSRKEHQETRERLIRIETLLTQIKKGNDTR